MRSSTGSLTYRERVNSVIFDFIWPTLYGDSEELGRKEHEKLEEEEKLIGEAASNLGSDEEKLKGYLGVCEKLLEAEGSRKAGIEARLLSTAGLVSIAGTVVMGALFSLASENLAISSSIARVVLATGCLYLTVQLVAALHASVRGLRATGYAVDRPHELLPPRGTKHSVYLRRRIQLVLVRVAENRQVNNGKLDQLNIAHTALHNFLWGLLGVALIAFVAASAWLMPNTLMSSELPLPGGVNPPKGDGMSLGQPLSLISTGIFLLALGGVLLGLSNSTSRRVVAAAITSSGLGFTLLGAGNLDATLFKVERLIGELRFEVSVGSKSRPHHAFIRRIATVGPFPDGEHLLATGEVASCVTLALAQYKGKPIGGWEVVGRVDKRQLRPDRAKVYGSNQALAMARASWVAQEALSQQSSFDITHAVVSVGGARRVGEAVYAGDLQSDRAVDIFVIVNASLNDKGVADLPGPVICPMR